MCEGHDRGELDRRLLLQVGAALSAAGTLASIAPAEAATPPSKFDQADVAEIIKDWPSAAKAATEEMLRKYGPPQEATATLLIWRNNGPWKRTIVHKEAVEHDFPAKHMDTLEQVAEYKVPLNFFNPLAAFNGSVIVDRTRGELTVHCDKETTNFVALNLAHDIVSGRKTQEQARDAFAETVRDLQAGRTPEYAQELRLGPPQGDLRDTDTPVIAPASGSSQR